MIAPLRRAHRITFILLALGLPALLAGSLSLQPRLSGNSTSVVLATSADEETFEACWGATPIRLTTSARTEAGMQGAALSATTDDEAGGIQGAAGAATSIEFSDGTKHLLEGGEQMILRAVGTAITRIDLLATPRDPGLIAYWVPGLVEPGTGLDPDARRLTPVSAGQPTAIAHPVIPSAGATLALYSLGRDQTVGVIHLRPDFFIVRSCS